MDKLTMDQGLAISALVHLASDLGTPIDTLLGISKRMDSFVELLSFRTCERVLFRCVYAIEDGHQPAKFEAIINACLKRMHQVVPNSREAAALLERLEACLEPIDAEPRELLRLT